VNPHPPPQSHACDAREQHRRAEQPPRRQCRCARCRTCACRHTSRAPATTYRFGTGTARFAGAGTSRSRAKLVTGSPTGPRTNQTKTLRQPCVALEEAAHVLCAHRIDASCSDERHRDTRPDCPGSGHPRLRSARHRIPRGWTAGFCAASLTNEGQGARGTGGEPHRRSAPWMR